MSTDPNEKPAWSAHIGHGQGNSLTGPVDPGCPCRLTVEMDLCAKVGCGFCEAGVSSLDRLLCNIDCYKLDIISRQELENLLQIFLDKQ